ncbi:MAG: hypothetical protein DRN17_08375 [Thermoplasmata archaeon]|nr:MAG: hypothetical protein DRN17_08375 [Thermoplasmata archaeon]
MPKMKTEILEFNSMKELLEAASTVQGLKVEFYESDNDTIGLFSEEFGEDYVIETASHEFSPEEVQVACKIKVMP